MFGHNSAAVSRPTLLNDLSHPSLQTRTPPQILRHINPIIPIIKDQMALKLFRFVLKLHLSAIECLIDLVELLNAVVQDVPLKALFIGLVVIGHSEYWEEINIVKLSMREVAADYGGGDARVVEDGDLDGDEAGGGRGLGGDGGSSGGGLGVERLGIGR